jgi:aerobic-type carbon monoxide dehydrogenase small subunit (CoxS/CutS family)
VVASTNFLTRNPNPTYEEVKKGLGGNLCRCGTYVGIRKAVLEAAAEMGGKNA